MKCMAMQCTGLAISFFLIGSTPIRAATDHREQAWEILRTNLEEKSTDKRVQAVRVLALLPGDTKAMEFAEKAADDEKPDVRVAAARALGEFREKSALATLRKLLDDDEPTVALAAASALVATKDPGAYETYYEFLTGERKTGKGVIAEQMKTLKDPKKMAAIGIEEGVGFIPFAGIGLTAFKMLHVDDVSPVRAAAARMLANDPDPVTAQALVDETSDKSWLVQTAALEALAKRGDPKLLVSIVPAMMDDNIAVKCTAAAAVIRLSTISAKRNTRTKTAEPSVRKSPSS